MAEKKQVYSCHKTSFPDPFFFLPAMFPLSTLILMEYSLRQLFTIAQAWNKEES